DLLPDLAEEERAAVQRQAQRMSGEDLDRAFRLLVAAETELGRVPYPKLFLEMTLIKLATLTPVLPVDELLERIAELERSLGATAGGSSAGAAGQKRPPPARESGGRAPRSAPAPASEVAAAPALTAPSSTAAGWEEFLAFVGKEKVTLLPYLQTSLPPPIEGA